MHTTTLTGTVDVAVLAETLRTASVSPATRSHLTNLFSHLVPESERFQFILTVMGPR